MRSTILLAVDDPGRRTALVNGLSRAGHDVVVAIDGDDPLPLHPSVIVVDRADSGPILASRDEETRVVVVADLSRLGSNDDVATVELARPVRVRTVLEVVERLCRPESRAATPPRGGTPTVVLRRAPTPTRARLP